MTGRHHTADSERLELCRTLTADGLQLDGLLIAPTRAADDLPVSAFLLVHGTGSNFYAPGVLETFARQAVQSGSAVLRVNTRGHDGVARIPGQHGSVPGGAAYETISDCRLDIAAWVEFLVNCGHSRIGLVGHSMGAVKAIYAQAHDHHEPVRRVVGISPPRFCHARLMSFPQSQPFREDDQRARDLVKAGRGAELLSVRQPLPMLLTAEGFLAKYGPRDDYDYFKFLPNLNCPTLIVLGTESVRTSAAFAGVPEDLSQRIAELPAPPVTVELVEGANTAYSQHLTEPYVRAECWLRRTGNDSAG